MAAPGKLERLDSASSSKVRMQWQWSLRALSMLMLGWAVYRHVLQPEWCVRLWGTGFEFGIHAWLWEPPEVAGATVVGINWGRSLLLAASFASWAVFTWWFSCAFARSTGQSSHRSSGFCCQYAEQLFQNRHAVGEFLVAGPKRYGSGIMFHRGFLAVHRSEWEDSLGANLMVQEALERAQVSNVKLMVTGNARFCSGCGASLVSFYGEDGAALRDDGFVARLPGG